jgi:hypothetical protein
MGVLSGFRPPNTPNYFHHHCDSRKIFIFWKYTARKGLDGQAMTSQILKAPPVFIHTGGLVFMGDSLRSIYLMGNQEDHPQVIPAFPLSTPF